MLKKNTAKISLSTILLILSVITIIVMGVCIYELNNIRIAEIQKSAELQSQVDDLKTTITTLQKQSKVSSKDVLSNKNSDISIFGIYQDGYATRIIFDNETFNLKLDSNFELNGYYEIINNNYVICNITDYNFNSPDNNPEKHSVQDWSISFDIIDNYSLEVTDIDIPTDETEIVITIYNLINVGNIYNMIES